MVESNRYSGSGRLEIVDNRILARINLSKIDGRKNDSEDSYIMIKPRFSDKNLMHDIKFRRISGEVEGLRDDGEYYVDWSMTYIIPKNTLIKVNGGMIDPEYLPNIDRSFNFTETAKNISLNYNGYEGLFSKFEILIMKQMLFSY